MTNQPKLFTPGPVDVFDETLAALGNPVPYMMHPGWLAVQAETSQMLKRVFQTENGVFMATSPGSGAIETGVASLFQAGDRVVAVRNGMFAERPASGRVLLASALPECHNGREFGSSRPTDDGAW